MKETYNALLRQHIMQALTDPKAVNLKDFVQQLITVNEAAREDILKAYQEINEELVGTLDA